MSAAFDASARQGPVLVAEHLTKHFPAPRGRRVYAVDDVSLTVDRGEIVALVGESGSGKSTIAGLVTRIHPPPRGRIEVLGQDITRLGGDALIRARRQVRMVFQDPFASLNPVHTVEYHVRRPMELVGDPVGAAARRQRVDELLETVGLTPPELFRAKFPHELSGGQRQRVTIARALSVRPALLIADEPTSMLDVSIRIGIMNLLRDLVRRERLAMLYITHDLAGARYLAHRTLVMYAGRVVEEGPTGPLIDNAKHPYTQLLLSAVPVPRGEARPHHVEAGGEVPDMTNPPAGCRFHPRCPLALDICRTAAPEAIDLAPGHRVRCYLYDPNHQGTQARGRDDAGAKKE
jgi:peptide/nickel transport system ATP-binding protein